VCCVRITGTRLVEVVGVVIDVVVHDVVGSSCRHGAVYDTRVSIHGTGTLRGYALRDPFEWDGTVS
jgi:hypothetical protein